MLRNEALMTTFNAFSIIISTVEFLLLLSWWSLNNIYKTKSSLQIGLSIYEDFKDCICPLSGQIRSIKTYDMHQMNPNKKISKILQSQFIYHKLRVTPFKSCTFNPCLKLISPLIKS